VGQTDRHTHSPIVEVPQHFVLWDLKRSRGPRNSGQPLLHKGKNENIKVLKYACLKVCKYASMQVCQYMQVFKNKKIKDCDHLSMQIYENSMRLCKYVNTV
jgi:hypothetical protein